MRISNGQLYMALRALKEYIEDAEGLERIIINHSLAAAAAAVAAGWIPGAGGVIATGIAMGFTISMYVRICNYSKITLKKNALKAIASVVVAEIAAYLAVIIAAEVILTFIPVVGNLGGAVIAAVLNFAMVYIAGLLFLKMIVSVFKANKDINSMSEEELKEYIKAQATKDNIKTAYKEAKEAYKQNKDDDSYKSDNIHPEN